MHTRSWRRILLAAAAAAVAASVALAASAPIATAESFGFSPAGNISILGPVTLTTEEGSIRCRVTLSGTLTRSLVSAARGTAFGSLTEGRFSECEGGVTVRPLLPAELIVFQFLFPLGSERLVGILFLIERIGVLFEKLLSIQQCLFGPTAPMLLEVNTGLSGEIRPLATPSFRLLQTLGMGRCPLAMTLSGALRLSPQQEVIYLRI